MLTSYVYHSFVLCEVIVAFKGGREGFSTSTSKARLASGLRPIFFWTPELYGALYLKLKLYYELVILKVEQFQVR